MPKLLISSQSPAGPSKGAIIDTSGAGSIAAGILIPYTPNSRGAVLPDGKLCCLTGNAVGPLRIFTWDGATTFTQVATFGTDWLLTYGININNGKFWALAHSNSSSDPTASFYKFDENGSLLAGPIGPIPNVFDGNWFCVSPDETIAYYADFATNNIQRWDLVNNVALSAGPAYNSNWLIDGMWNVNGTTDYVIAATDITGPGHNLRVATRYTAAGGTVWSVTFYSLPAPATDGFEEFALDTALDGFWYRSAGPPSYVITTDMQFGKVAFSNGSVSNVINVACQAGPIPGSTCFMVDLTASAPVPPDRGGLYHMPPNSPTRHDNWYTVTDKIPNPTIRTALIGE